MTYLMAWLVFARTALRYIRPSSPQGNIIIGRWNATPCGVISCTSSVPKCVTLTPGLFEPALHSAEEDLLTCQHPIGPSLITTQRLREVMAGLQRAGP